MIDLCQFSSFKILTNQSSKDTAIFWWMVKLLRIVNIKIFLYFCALIYYILLITVYWISNWYHVYKIHRFTHSLAAPVNISPASHKTVKLKKCLNKLKCIVYIYIVTDECRFNFLHCRWFDKLLYSAIFKHALILTAVRSGTYIIVCNFDFLTLIQFNSVIMKEYLAYINLFLIYLF